MKIYIIGPSGSGKTTLANKLSKKYNIKNYELDCLVYDDEHDHVKRSDEEIEKLFTEVLNKSSWIIDDVGRDRFNKGLDFSDKIYYINISKLRIYYRVVKRWILQRLGKEKYNYPPTLWQFFDMLRTAKKHLKNKKKIIDKLKKYDDKVEYLDYKKLNDFE